MEIPIPDLERAAAAGWRAPEEIPLGGWLLRAAGGFTGRANSGQVPPPVSRRLLVSAPWQAFGSVREAGQVLAIRRLAAAGEWAGFTAFEVDPARRRRGLASAIIGALAGLARDRGISGL